MEETYNIQAIILRRRPFREADLYIDVFSHELGKVELIARGAKKTNSKLAGHLEPFNLSKIMVVRGKQLNYAGGASCIKSFSSIKSDLIKSNCAGRGLKFFNEMIKSEEGETASELFSCLFTFLNGLEVGQKDYDLFLEIFKFHILSLLGYQLQVDRCSNCKSTLEEEKFYFNFANRNFLCAKCFSSRDLLISKELLSIIKKESQFLSIKNNIIVREDLEKINNSLVFDL